MLVDTGNYYPGFREGVIEEIENGMTESEWVEKQIGRSVTKAFNNIFAKSLASLGNTASDPNDRITLSVSGDDYPKKTIVMNLIYELGFTPFDQGTIKDSWRQQPGSTLYCTDLKKDQVIKLLAQMPGSYNAQIQKTFAEDRDIQAKKYM